LPQAAAGFAHVLSTHWPQSVLPNDGGGGAAAAVSSGAALFEDVSAAEEADADAAGEGVSAALDSSELVEEELSEAGLSGGLDSPPPHASQGNGTATRRARAVAGRWRLMVFDGVARNGAESKREVLVRGGAARQCVRNPRTKNRPPPAPMARLTHHKTLRLVSAAMAASAMAT
jgi:hypothetical protein